MYASHLPLRPFEKVKFCGVKEFPVFFIISLNYHCNQEIQTKSINDCLSRTRLIVVSINIGISDEINPYQV